MRFAQVNDDNQVVQFVGFNTTANALAHCQANPDCLFVPTEYFGSPKDFAYDAEAGEITPSPGTND